MAQYQRYARHLPVVAALVGLQLLAPWLWTGYYLAVERPRLLRQGATQCASQPSRSPDRAPNDCDLALTMASGARRQDIYYSRSGRDVTTVTWQGTTWYSTETNYRHTSWSLVLPGAAMLAMFMANVRKMFRTGAVFSWQLAKHPADEVEQLIYLYALPVFGAGMLSPLLWQMAAG